MGKENRGERVGYKYLLLTRRESNDMSLARRARRVRVTRRTPRRYVTFHPERLLSSFHPVRQEVRKHGGNQAIKNNVRRIIESEDKRRVCH
jgi:hypothetical protein